MQQMLEKIPLNNSRITPMNNRAYMYDTSGARVFRHTDLQAFILNMYDKGANWLNEHPDHLAKYHQLPKYERNNGSWNASRINPLHTAAIFVRAFDLMEPKELFQIFDEGCKNLNKPLLARSQITEGPHHAMTLPDGNKLEETDIHLVLKDYIYCHPEKFAKFKVQTHHEHKFIPPYFIKPEYHDIYLAIVSESAQPQLKVHQPTEIAEVELLLGNLLNTAEKADVKFNQQGYMEVSFSKPMEGFIELITFDISGITCSEQTLIIPPKQLEGFKKVLQNLWEPHQLMKSLKVSLEDRVLLLEPLSKKLVCDSKNPENCLMADSLYKALRPRAMSNPAAVLWIIEELFAINSKKIYADQSFFQSATQKAFESILTNAYLYFLKVGLENNFDLHSLATSSKLIGWGMNRYRVYQLLKQYPIKQEIEAARKPLPKQELPKTINTSDLLQLCSIGQISFHNAEYHKALENFITALVSMPENEQAKIMTIASLMACEVNAIDLKEVSLPEEMNLEKFTNLRGKILEVIEAMSDRESSNKILMAICEGAGTAEKIFQESSETHYSYDCDYRQIAADVLIERGILEWQTEKGMNFS